MKKLFNSSFIFNLIDEYQIVSLSGKVNSLTDEDFMTFGAKYKQESIKRDSALFQYLNTTQNLFRCHLPYSKWTLSVAKHVVWFYDELLITDPVLDIINNPLNEIRDQKHRLQNILDIILEFKESITGGYILFAGGDLVPNKTGLFDSESELLLTDGKVLGAFEQDTLMLKRASKINDDERDNLTQIQVQYEGMWGENRSMGMYIPPHVLNSGKLNGGVTFDFMGLFHYAQKDEIIAMGKQDMFDTIKAEYIKDITVVLETLANAQRLNAPVLFYRDVDCTVAEQYAWFNSNVSNTSIVNTSVYDFALPYLQNIPSERLFEMRTQIPQAFNEFRYFLYDLVNKTIKATNNPAEMKYRFDSEVTSTLRKLEVEMRNAKRKMNFHGVAAPILAGIGSLGLFSSGIDYSKLLTIILGTTGGIRTITTIADVKSDRKKAETNPVYFLWKAQQ